MRFCYQCGSSLEEGAKFCPKCGHKVQEQFIQPAQQPEVTRYAPAPKKKTGKVLIIALIACVLVAGLITGAIVIFRGKKDKEGGQGYAQENSAHRNVREFLVHYREDTNELYVINQNGKVAKLKKVDSNSDDASDAKYDYMSDLYGKKAVFSVCSDGDYTLYYYDGELKKITDDYYNSRGYGYTISDDGSTVVYVSGNGDIWSYKNGKSTKIASDISVLTALSPDGGTVGYTRYDEDDDSIEGWYSTGGREQKLGGGVEPILISNGAEIIAISNNSDYSVYIQNGSDSTTRVELKNHYPFWCALVNKDCTAFMYVGDNGTYIWKKGMESPEKVSPQNLELVSKNDSTISTRGAGSSAVVYRYLNTDLDGSVWYDADDYESSEKVKLYMFSKNDIEYLVSVDDSSVFFSEDKIYFVEDGSVKFIEKNKPGADPVTVVKSGAKIAIELNKQLIFVITEDDELKMIKNGKEQSIYDTSNISSKYFFLDSGFFYCLRDDNKIYMTDGGKPKKVSGISGEPKGYEMISQTGSKVAIIITDTGAYYTIDGGISFKPLYKV